MNLLQQVSYLPYHPAYKKLCGSTVGAVFLSKAMCYAAEAPSDGWFCVGQVEWQDDTGLTRREQETARTSLKVIGVLEEKRQGVPAKLYYRVDKEKLQCLLNQLE